MGLETFSLDSEPYGKTWQLWVAEWWKWCYAEPLSSSPITDNDGKFASRYQEDPNVWFLGGTAGGYAERTCTVPSGKSLFFPIVNDFISFAEYEQLKTEDELKSYSKADLDTTSICEVNIDDYQLDKTYCCRFQSDPFHMRVPIPTSEGMVYTDTVGVTDGYWAFIKNLSAGRHSLLINGEKAAYDDIVTSDSPDLSKRFISWVKYSISVK